MNQLDDLERLCRAARRGEDPRADDFGAVQRGVARRLGLAAATGSIAVSKVGSALGGSTTAVLSGIGGAAKALLPSAIVTWVLGGAALGGTMSWLVASELSSQPVSSVTPHQTKLLASPGVRRSPERAVVTPPVPAPTPSTAVQDDRLEVRAVARADSAATSDRPAPRTRAYPRPEAPARTGHDREAPPSSLGLADEARALAEVQRALRDGRSERALELLSEMDARFGSGALGAERLAAQVLALCAGGRVEEGRAASKRFIVLYPGSPLIDRIQAACMR